MGGAAPPGPAGGSRALPWWVMAGAGGAGAACGGLLLARRWRALDDEHGRNALGGDGDGEGGEGDGEVVEEPEPGDRGHLVGLRSRPDLNGRRVEVKGPAPGKEGAPRFRVELLFGTGAGTVLKVKAANLELDKDSVLDDPALNTLVAAMQALAPGATPAEERRDWAGGVPIEGLAKIAQTHVAKTEARFAASLKSQDLER